MELLDKLHKNGATICIVTHDPRSAEQAQRKIEGRPFYILHPHSTGIALWDVVTTIALLFVSALTRSCTPSHTRASLREPAAGVRATTQGSPVADPFAAALVMGGALRAARTM